MKLKVLQFVKQLANRSNALRKKRNMIQLAMSVNENLQPSSSTTVNRTPGESEVSERPNDVLPVLDEATDQRNACTRQSADTHYSRNEDSSIETDGNDISFRGILEIGNVLLDAARPGKIK